jgi:hypothetical protein
MEVVRLPRDTMEVASAAAYYHTTSAVDDAWHTNRCHIPYSVAWSENRSGIQWLLMPIPALSS